MVWYPTFAFPVLGSNRHQSGFGERPGGGYHRHVISPYAQVSRASMENQLALDALKIKLGEIASARRQCERRLPELARDRDTINRALVIMGGETNEGAVSLGIATGAFTRTILETLRDAKGPLCTREIATVLASRSERALGHKEFNLVIARVRNALPRISDGLDGELRGRTTYWSVKEQAVGSAVGTER